MIGPTLAGRWAVSGFVKDSGVVEARLVALDEQLRTMFEAKAGEPAPARLVDLVDRLEAAARVKQAARSAPAVARPAELSALKR
jgi:hypothetical protein